MVVRNGANRARRAERRLFEVHARLSAARSELDILEAQHRALAEDAEEARVRMLVSETALANREWEEARRHAEVLARRLAEARRSVAELERAQGELLDDLLI